MSRPEEVDFKPYVCSDCSADAIGRCESDLEAGATMTFAEGSTAGASQGSIAEPSPGSSIAGQPSSSSSYVGPLARPMLAEPHSDVFFMKPLAKLTGSYSACSIKYMLKKCNCNLVELTERARSFDTSKIGANGLPLQINPWGVKWKNVLDDVTGKTERIMTMPGLICKGEDYPSKEAFEERWRKALVDVFAPPSMTGLEEAMDEEAGHWRFDVLEQLLRSNDLQGRPLPSSLAHMTFLQWNAGGTRQRLDAGSLSGGSLHFGSMQEVDPDIVASLERWGAIVYFYDNEPPGKPTCTFARADFIQRSRQLLAEVIPRYYQHHGETVKAWLMSYSIARYEFKFEIAGRTLVTIASAHLCNEWAKKRDIATEAILHLLETCHAYEVDIIGCDLNQAVALRKSHVTSPLFEAIKQFCSKHGVNPTYPYESLYGQAPGDCCGFIIMPTSSIFAECVVEKHGWQPFVSTDIGLRRTDLDAHHPNHMWLRSKTYKRTSKHSQEGWLKVEEKKKKNKEMLQAKKKAKKSMA